MPQNFYSKLEKLLKQDTLFIDQEGDLLKSNVIDAAYKVDKKLVESLLSQAEFKNQFFADKMRNYKNRKLNRLKGYNYSQNGLYFITICVKNRECFFGEILNSERQLSDIETAAEKFWREYITNNPLKWEFDRNNSENLWM